MDIQLKENPKKEKSTFVTTITSSKKYYCAKKSLPLCTKKVPRGNNVVMPKKPSRHLPPRKEVDREAELEEIKKQSKELSKGIARVNGLLVTHTRRQDSVADVTMMRHGRCINRWGRVSHSANSQ